MRNYNESEKKIVYKMIELGLNIQSKGFGYIVDAVNIINDANGDIKLTAVYHMIAKNNNSEYHRVERCIRSEVERIYNKHNNLPPLFVSGPESGKLTNGEFICRLILWLQEVA